MATSTSRVKRDLARVEFHRDSFFFFRCCGATGSVGKDKACLIMCLLTPLHHLALLLRFYTPGEKLAAVWVPSDLSVADDEGGVKFSSPFQ